MAEPKEGYNSGITRVVSSGVIDSDGNYVAGGATPVNISSTASDLVVKTNSAKYDWVMGDDTTAVTIVASDNEPSLPIDMSGYIPEQTTLQMIIGLTGTGKLNVKGSRDGVSDFQDLGDRVTGMVAGSSPYILKMDDTNLAYFPFYVFTFTETGTSNSISVQAILMGQSNDV